MNITDELATRVAAQVKSGKMLHQVAQSMQIDVETAALAFIRWTVSDMPARA
ncbi:MAG: hypothetical protein K0R39_243 [Symbiobacteriaceae bacterium]|jgi:hypothetical protein|nr:hypothetical protein [Symbiobacteriaceae bacterium]